MIETAVLMCHAPIVVPAIGGARGAASSATTAAMRRVAEHVVATGAEALVLVSPHAARRPAAFGLSRDRVLLDFAHFGAPELAIDLPPALPLTQVLVDAAREVGVATEALPDDPADHGAAVPAFFLCEAGFAGPTLRVALPYPGSGTELRFGQALARAAERCGHRLVVVASGDLSHRLVPGAPAGYDARASSFDRAFVGHLAEGDLRAACATDPGLRGLAAEDAVDSTTVAAAAVDFDSRGHELFGYEGPYGVGYAEAILYHRAAPPQTLLSIARDAVVAAVEARSYEPPPLEPPWDRPRAVFVTLRERDGKLRGCIGRTQPNEVTLCREVASAATSAATTDPRFPQVTRAEFPGLSYTVSVLDAPEPVAGFGDLDPTRYGVVVSAGSRRGVLLPHVPGVLTVADQVRFARDKAGIGREEPVRLERFAVREVSGFAP